MKKRMEEAWPLMSLQTTLISHVSSQTFAEPLETLIYALGDEEIEIDPERRMKNAGQYSPGVNVKGFFPTPQKTVDQMVESLFLGRVPCASDTLLDPGCGDGAFIGGVLRWCERNNSPVPRIMGVDSDPCRVKKATERYGQHSSVSIVQRDFLRAENEFYDYIIGNPPYVPITQLSEHEKVVYRRKFSTARKRFDLYLLFFEEALTHLKKGGRMVFITPEKFIYVDTAAPLRKLLTTKNVEELRMVAEGTFGELVAYPTITIVTNTKNDHRTIMIKRDGTNGLVDLPTDGRSWLPAFNGHANEVMATRLEEICTRISCGVATGADSIYVQRTSQLPSDLAPFAYPTVAGRQIDSRRGLMNVVDSMLVPYHTDGRLMRDVELGALGTYLRSGGNHTRLRARTCARRKPWFAFHENPPMGELLQPKILCKDIGEAPYFILDIKGELIPRHTVYYIIPKDPSQIDALLRYLNGPEAREWLVANCQRAANGFLRIQSQVLKRLPVPPVFTDAITSKRSSAGIPLYNYADDA